MMPFDILQFGGNLGFLGIIDRRDRNVGTYGEATLFIVDNGL